jgi:tRNA(Ile2) C34 agmatinyltransferase TiaS
LHFNAELRGVKLQKLAGLAERLPVADDIDLANEMLDAQISIAVAKAGKLEIPINTTGRCLSCGETVENGRRWCDADCREHYEQRKNKKYTR